MTMGHVRLASSPQEYCRIVKAQDQVTLHMTAASYQVLSGQLVGQSPGRGMTKIKKDGQWKWMKWVKLLRNDDP